MRILTVIGVMGAGLAIGTTAILAPVVSHSADPGTGWISEWGTSVARNMRAAVQDRAPAKPAQSEAAVATGTPSGARAPLKAGPDIKTIELPNFGTSAKASADARIVELPWVTQVTVAPENAPPRKQTSSKPSSDEQRRSLVRDIQTELRRVGCFDAEADGQWGGASKRAMSAFTERVNATLPTEEPDFILLTLVQGHKGVACGKGCPAGQGANDAGRCTPNAILAHADRGKQAKPDRMDARNDDSMKDHGKLGAVVGSAWTATTIKAPIATAPPAPVIAARPALASPPVVAALRPVPAAPAEVTIAAITPAPVFAARPPQPLAGRMAIGAPLPPAGTPPVALVPKTGTKLAAAEAASELPSPPKTAVTQAAPETSQVPRVTRPEPNAKQPARETTQTRPKRAPEVVVHRPPPPKIFAPPPSYLGAPPGNASKSRRLVYELFQRPDRN